MDASSFLKEEFDVSFTAFQVIILLNLFDQYTNLCCNITKIFIFIYIYIILSNMLVIVY